MEPSLLPLLYLTVGKGAVIGSLICILVYGVFALHAQMSGRGTAVIGLMLHIEVIWSYFTPVLTIVILGLFGLGAVFNLLGL